MFWNRVQSRTINCQLKNIILTLLSSIFSVKIYIIQALINISAFILKSWHMLAVLIVSNVVSNLHIDYQLHHLLPFELQGNDHLT